ncbi:hypothetical protein BUE80_DR009946 [Diplocarpon rosae]|nr:hypothetical protein BUE80_DR009946 [Diplocarpon rosae]
MAFIFTLRSTPFGSMHRRDPQSTGSLPAISEDSVSFLYPRQPPPVPPRAFNRPEFKQFAFGVPPGMNFDGSPPPYSHYSKSADVRGSHGEMLSNPRNRRLKDNKHVVGRGGWKRFAIPATVVILCLVGLIVGLVIGLQDRNQKSIDTYLSTITTNFTSNPATWRCYPYFTYAQSPSQATATFDWIITPVESSNNNYTISSTDNYFSLVFSNTSLSLMNAGADDEHYFFQ